MRSGPGISTRRQALSFVNDVGFCFVFRTRTHEMPCLWNAVYGDGSTDRDTVAPHAPSFVWHLRGIMPGEKAAFCGKLLLRRPMLVSLEYFPHFYVLNEWRARNMHDGPALSHLSATARTLMEQLRRHSPQTSFDLRQRLFTSTGTGGSAFELALTELQTRMHIAAIESSGRPPSTAWALTSRLFRNQIRRAHRISVEEARRSVLERHFRNQFVLTVAEIRRLFRWERQEIFQTLGELIRRGIVTPEVQVEGIADRTYCLLT